MKRNNPVQLSSAVKSNQNQEPTVQLQVKIGKRVDRPMVSQTLRSTSGMSNDIEDFTPMAMLKVSTW